MSELNIRTSSRHGDLFEFLKAVLRLTGNGKEGIL